MVAEINAWRATSASEIHGRLDALDVFRGLAIVFVVAIHAGGYSHLSADPWGPTILTLVETIAVPAFFVTDGYLFASRMTGSRFSYRSYLEQSTRRLLWPWFVFTVIYGLAQAAAERNGLSVRPILQGKGAWHIVLLAYTSGFAAQMYFLLSLYIIRVLSIAWQRLVSTPDYIPWLVWISYTGLYRGWLSETYARLIPLPGLDPLSHAFWGLQFYLLGIAFARWHGLRSYAVQTAALAGVIAIGTRFLDPSPPAVFQYAYLVMTFAGCLSLARYVPALAALGRQTMGIYLLHTPILLKLASLVSAAVFSSVLLRFSTNLVLSLLGALALSVAISGTGLGRVLFGEPAPRARPRSSGRTPQAG